MQKVAFAEKCALQICAFCARRFFAHLQICTFVICAFAESFAHVEKFLCKLQICDLCFVKMCALTKMFFSSFRQNFQNFAKSVKFRKKLKNEKMSDSVPSVFDVFPKMSEKSSRVPEWYTSGSWANAFDNTGWQKSPEYALIRIAAGAPDLAKSPNPPRTAPGAPGKVATFPSGRKSSRIRRQGSLLLPRLKSFPELFFLIRAQLVRVVKRIPRRVEFCDRVRHILQMCAHFAKHSLKTAVRAQDILHTVHTVHNRNRHTCTTCAHPTHNSRHKWQRTHRPCVALVGGRRRADASFCIEHFLFL